jgi:hypothetical protein
MIPSVGTKKYQVGGTGGDTNVLNLIPSSTYTLLNAKSALNPKTQVLVTNKYSQSPVRKVVIGSNNSNADCP